MNWNATIEGKVDTTVSDLIKIYDIERYSIDIYDHNQGLSVFQGYGKDAISKYGNHIALAFAGAYNEAFTITI